MKRALRIRRPLPMVILLITVVLGACAPLPPPSRPPKQHEARMQALNEALAARHWRRAIVLAKELHESVPPESRIAAQALVRESWALLESGHERSARRLLRSHASRLVPLARFEPVVWHFLSRQTSQDPRGASLLAHALPPPPAALRADALSFRARLAWAVGEPLEALRLSIAAMRLRSPSRRAAASLRLWHHLHRWAILHGPLALPPRGGATLRGWIDLVDLDLRAEYRPTHFAALLTQWERDHPHHPARLAVLPRLLARLARLSHYPTRIAVLLPLHGGYANPGRAAADGILLARTTARGSGRTTAVRFFDTGTGPRGTWRAYLRARRWGAEFIIGPLLAQDVETLATRTHGHVPILALNDLPQGVPPPPRFYQFGISPEDEAREAARRALRHGYIIAGALVPRTAWGARVLAAFRQTYTRHGGRLAAVAYYRPDRHDYAGSVESLLLVHQSILRARTLESILGMPLKFEPVARQDLQVIFMPARTADARELRPELRYYGALTLPVYALANIDEPGISHPDLDGIRFPEMPWMLDGQGRLEKEARRLWPHLDRRDGRLIALGLDAYRLVPLLDHLHHPLRNPYPGVTGLLYLGRNHVIHRRLIWAVFRHGRPQALLARGRPTSVAPSTSFASSSESPP